DGDRGKSRSRRDCPRPRGGLTRAQARRTACRSARRAGVFGQRRQRFRHRSDHRGGRRQREYLKRCERFGRRGGGLQIEAARRATSEQELWLYCQENLISFKEDAMAVAATRKTGNGKPSPKLSTKPGPKHNIEAVRQAYYDRIAKHDMRPLWKVMESLV